MREGRTRLRAPTPTARIGDTAKGRPHEPPRHGRHGRGGACGLPHGLVACLDGFDGIDRVEAVASVAEAWAHPALGEAEVILVDASVDGAGDFVSDVLDFTDTRVVALAGKDQADRLGVMVEAGAVAALAREDLTAERLG